MKKKYIFFTLIVLAIISGCEKNSDKAENNEQTSQNISQSKEEETTEKTQESEYSAEKTNATLAEMGIKSYDIWSYLRLETGEETDSFLNKEYETVVLSDGIEYAEEKDEFTAARFIYDNIIAQYDCYFVDEQLKSYQCPICKRIYKEEDVAQAKVKRCFECDEKLIEIVHREVPMTEGNYTEVEVKILGLIGSLSEEEAMSASEIGDAIGCTWQKVSNWCSKVLGKQELINVKKVGGRNYYFDKE